MKLTLPIFAFLSAVAIAGPAKGPSLPKPGDRSVTEPNVPSMAMEADLDAVVRARIDSFFLLLKEGKTSAAYHKLFENSILAKEQPVLLDNFVKTTTNVLEKCGKVESASILRIRGAGKTLREVICIVNCEKRPMRWIIYAYYGEGRWQILDTDIDPELDSFFETGKPARK